MFEKTFVHLLKIITMKKKQLKKELKVSDQIIENLKRESKINGETIRSLNQDIDTLISEPNSIKAERIKVKALYDARMEFQILFGTRTEKPPLKETPGKPINKPPLGVVPKRIVQEKRHENLENAIKRYKDAGLEVPKEWIEEYEHLSDKLKENGNNLSNTVNSFKEKAEDVIIENLSKSISHLDIKTLFFILDDISDKEIHTVQQLKKYLNQFLD